MGREVTKDAILGIVLVILSGFAVLGYGIEKLLEQIPTSSLRTTPAEGFKYLLLIYVLLVLFVTILWFFDSLERREA